MDNGGPFWQHTVDNVDNDELYVAAIFHMLGKVPIYTVLKV